MKSIKSMTLNQLKKIIDNQYRGDPKKGHGKDYGMYIDLINERYHDILQKKEDAKTARHLKELNEYENIISDKKRCSNCRELKLKTYFSKTSCKRYLRSHCKKCRSNATMFYKNPRF